MTGRWRSGGGGSKVGERVKGWNSRSVDSSVFDHIRPGMMPVAKFSGQNIGTERRSALTRSH